MVILPYLNISAKGFYNYLKQIREELGIRVVDNVILGGGRFWGGDGKV